MELIIAIIGIAVLLGVKLNGKASQINYKAKMSECDRRKATYKALCGVGCYNTITSDDALQRWIFAKEFSYDEVIDILHNDLVYIFGENYRASLTSSFVFGGKNMREIKQRSDRLLTHLLLAVGGYIYDDAITGLGLGFIINGRYKERCFQAIERHLVDNYPEYDMNMTDFSDNGDLVFMYTLRSDRPRSWSVKPYDGFYSQELRRKVREHIQSALADPSVQNGTYGLRI